MKYNFTLLKIVRTLLFALCCMIGAEQVMAQAYLPTVVQEDADGYYTTLAKDNSGGLYVVKYSTGAGTYQLVRWAGANPASQTIVIPALASSLAENPTGLAVNPTNGDVFATNPNGAGEIIRVPGGTGTPVVVQSGKSYSALCMDATNTHLLALEYNSTNNTYAVSQYAADGSGSGIMLYNGVGALEHPNDGTLPWGIDTDSDNNIYITNYFSNSNGATEPGLMKLTAPAYTRTNLQLGRQFTGLTIDASNNIYAIEAVSSGSATFRVVKYDAANLTGTGSQLYTGLTSGLPYYPIGITEVNGVLYVTNPLGGPNSEGQVLKLSPPNVNILSINRATAASSSNASTVDFQVTFDGSATGGSNTNFAVSVVSGSITGASVGPVTGSPGTTRTVTVNTGTGNGTLRLDMMNSTGITPTVITLPFITGQTILIDKSAPTGSIAISNGATYATAYGVTLNLANADLGGSGGIQMEFSSDGITYSGYVAFAATAPFTLSGLDGTKTVYMHLRDAAGNVSTFQDNIILDRTAPETGIVSGPPDPTNSTSAPFDFFSDDAAATFELQLDGGTYAATTDPITLTGLTAGSHTINVRAVDAAGNKDLSPESYTWFIDLTAPVVSSVTVPGNGTYGATQQLNFTVVYNEAVTVTGTPSFPVTIGGTVVNATYVSGSGTANLLFRYTVATGNFDNNGIAVGSAIVLNGGTIVDAAGNNANLTLNSIGNTTLVLVDAVGPVVTSVTVPADGTYIIGQQLNFTVNFDENVIVTGTPSFPVTIGSNTVQATYISGAGSNAIVFRYTVQAGDSDNDGIAVGSSTIALNGGTLRDALANNATLTLNSIGNTTAVLVDTRMPIPTITSTATFPVTGQFTITITFDIPVTGTLTAGEFISLNATLSNVTPVNSTTWTATITPPAGQQNGSGSVRVSANAVTSVAGNNNLASNTFNTSWDTKVPVITVTPPANQYYKAGDIISFTITYDEDVVVTGAPTLPVTIDGTVRQATYTAGGDAHTLLFNYTVATGEQDLDGIDLAANIALNGGSIKDAAGNNAGIGIATTNYPGILVDGRAPTVVSVTMPGPGPTPSGYYNAGTSLIFTVTTSETVTVSGNPIFDVIIGSTTRQATFVNNVGNQLTFIYNIVDGDNDEDGITLGTSLSFPGASHIRDAAANNIVATLNGVGDGSAIRINTNHPTVTITPPQASTVVAPFIITVTFSEQTTDALALADFVLSGCTISALSTTDNITWTGLITPTANAQGAATIQLPADVVHNIATNGNQASAVYNFNYDTKSPAITSITPPANGTYKSGQTLTYIITYDDNFTVTGAPVLPIIIGSNTRSAALTTSTANTLTFSYTIVNGDEDLDGIALGNIALNGGTIKDAVGHDAALTTAGSYAGILVDGIIPTVTSVDVPVNGYYKAGAVLDFRVHTSENITVTGAPTLDVNIGGVVKQAALVSGAGTNVLVFSYTVVTGDNDADGIALSALSLNGGTLQDPVGNNMDLTLNGVPSTAGVLVNTVTPTVTLSNQTVVNGPWTMTITFSEPVTGLALTDFSTTNANLTSLASSSGSVYTVEVEPQADGTVSINLPADAAVNVGDNGNAASNTITYTYDGTAPTVTSVAVPANGTYTNSDVLNFDVNFSEAVTVSGGTPSVPITIGAATVQATYVGGTGTGTLTFSYSIQNGDYDMNGIAVGAAIALNGAAIKDASDNNATLTLNSVGNTSAVLVDAVPPAITSVNVPANGYYKAGDVLTFTVDFNENVAVTGTPSVPVIIGASTVQASYVSGSGTNTLVFTYTVVPGDNDIDGIAVGSALALNGGTVKDGLGNDAALALNSVGNTDNVFVNTVIPTVTLSGTPVLNGPWLMTITFSEPVTDFTATDITATNAGVSAPLASGSTTYTVLVTPPADGPVSLTVPANGAFNIGGNGNSASNTINYIHDGTAPSITSVNVPSAGGYNAGDALNFTVNFDENVIVTGTPSIPVTIGATTVQATYVSGSGTAALLFTYTVQNGNNDADGIALGAAIALNGGTIKDAATNNAVLTLNSVGSTSGVIVDAVAPVVTSVTVPANGYYKGGQQLNFTVNFSENVTPSAVPSIPVTIGSTVVEADYVSGSGTNALLFTYTVQPGDMDMDGIAVGSTISLNLGTIKDGVGNDAVLTLNNIANTSNVFVNTNSPTVVLSGTPVLNGPWTMTITFSEVVTGFTLADITATNATVSNLNQSGSTSYTVLVTATANGTVTLNVPANIADNIGGNGNAASNTITYTHDGIPPVISAVSVPANGTYSTGDALNFTVNFTENVVVTGTPSLPLTIGATAVQATYTGGSGTNALSFSYTVLSGQADADGIALGAALGLNGGTIADAAANNAILALNGVGNTSAVLVDAIAPVITSVTVPANGYYKAGDVLNFSVNFNKNIAVTGTPSFPVTIGATAVQAAYTTGTGTNALSFTYTVQTGEVDLDGIAVGSTIALNGGTLKDALGNDAAPALNNVGSTSNVFVLAVRPGVNISGAVNLRQPWTVIITFSHAVTGFALSDFTLTNATVSNLQTTDNITYTALLTPGVEGGVSISIPANIAQDAAGNQNTISSVLSYYYDPNPPLITSVEVPANGYYKQGDVLNFAVNWNETVRNNVSPSRLTLPVIIGSTTVQATYTGGYNSQRLLFAYTVQAGQMDLDGIQLGTALQLAGGTERVTDLSGNDANLTLNNVAATNGVFVHTARPSVTLTSAAAARLNAPFTVTVTFNEAVTQLAATDFTLTNATASNLQTTDNKTYTILVTPTVDGAVSISLPADAAVNVVGNGNTASNSITRTYDATPPAIAAGQTFTVSQYSAAGMVVGTVTATDASGTVQNWAIATDGSAGALQISTAGVISVKNTTLLNALVGTDVTLGVTVSDGLNTSTAVPVTVRVVFVNQPPTLNVISNVAICKDVQTHTIQLTGASATEPGQTYTITATSTSNIFDVLTVGAGNVLSYRLKADAPAGAATVAVTIRDNGGTTGGAVDSLRRTFTITVNALPVINITSDKGASVSKGDIVKLTATGGSTYVWSAADGIISGQRTPVLVVKPMANTSYEVTAASAAGCTAVGSFALSVVVDFKVDAVNILTPNGDGRNDRWVIRNLDSYPDNEVKIYDRAGRLIYSRRNYSNDWDGTVNGSPLAEGTYYYILTIQNGAKTATGYITIVRDRY